MEIRINSEEVYSRLSVPILTPSEEFFTETFKDVREAESWKNPPKPKKPIFNKVYLEQLSLPPPFHVCGGLFERIDDFYSGEIILSPSYQFYCKKAMKKCHPDRPARIAFHGLFDNLKGIYKEKWMGTENGGYILSNQNPFISFFLNDYRDTLEIGMGKRGAERRKFGSFEEFQYDINNLENVTNQVISSFISMTKSKNPETVLTLNPYEPDTH